MMRLSMDLKGMPQSYKWHQFILVINKVTIFMVTIPIYQSISEEIGKVLIEFVFNKYSIPRMHDHGSRQCIHVCIDKLLIKKLGITIKTITPNNHQPL